MTDTISFEAAFSGFLQLAAVPAVVSAVVSGVVTMLVNTRQMSEKRHFNYVEDRTDLYAYFILHLDAMRYKGEAMKKLRGRNDPEPIYVFTKEEFEGTLLAIDSKIKNKSHLISPEILKLWIYVKTMSYNPEVKSHVDKLRELLVKEYDDIIVPEYNKSVRGKISKIGQLPVKFEPDPET